MKSILQPSALALIALVGATAVHAELIGYDGFGYRDGPLGQQEGGSFWDLKNTTSQTHTFTPSNWGTLNGTPVIAGRKLVTSSAATLREYNGANETEGAVNDVNVSKAVYYRWTMTPTVNVSFAGVSSYDFTNERVYFGIPSGGSVFGLVDSVSGASALTGTAVVPGTPFTLVAKIDFAADVIALYVNPNLAGTEASNQVAPRYAQLAYPGTNWSTGLRIASGGTGSVTWDNLLVATTWTELTPKLVTTDLDNPTGTLPFPNSLRQAVEQANASAGSDLILIDPSIDTIGLRQTLNFSDPGAAGVIALDGGYGNRSLALIPLSGMTNTLVTVGTDRSASFQAVHFFNARAGSGTFGGAVRNNGSLLMTDCLLQGNAAPLGGAIYSSPGSSTRKRLLMNRCTLAGNTCSTEGSALFLLSTDAVLTQCTLTGNLHADGSNGQGSVLLDGGPLRMDHCTMVKNQFGMLNFERNDAANPLRRLTLRNSIVQGNGTDFADGTAASVTFEGANLVGTLPAGAFAGPMPLTTVTELSPLADYGGVTPTMPPLAYSAAVDKAVGSVLVTDQRGLPRGVDGDANGTATADLGAVELGSYFVTTAADELDTPAGAALSLREALRDVPPFSTIQFAAGVFTGTPPPPITLQAGQGALSIPRQLVLDGALPGNRRVNVNGGNATRILTVPAAVTANLANIDLTNGRITGTGAAGAGGAVQNAGRLTLQRCGLTNNRADEGGALHNLATGNLTLTECQISANQSSFDGGAVSNAGTLKMTGCSLTENIAILGNGGGFTNTINATLDLERCTLVENTAFQRAGLLYNTDGAVAYFTHCTAAFNVSAQTSAVIYHGGTGSPITSIRYSVFRNDPPGEIDTTRGTGFVEQSLLFSGAIPAISNGTNGNIIGGTALLGGYNDYGGPTLSLSLMPGSPAINAAPASPSKLDQRGFPIIGIPDMGAYEFGTSLYNYNTYIWETVTRTTALSNRRADQDLDEDGYSNDNEYLALTEADNPASFFAINYILARGISVAGNADAAAINIPTKTGRRYWLERSAAMTPGTWFDTGLSPIIGNGSPQTFYTEKPANTYFFRVRYGP